MLALGVVQPAQLVQGLDRGGKQRRFVAVHDLDRQGLTTRTAGHDLHAVRPHFADPIAPACTHEVGVVAPGARDQFGVCAHGLAQLLQALAVKSIGFGAGQTGIAAGQARQGHGVVGGRATVDAQRQFFFAQTGQVRHGLAHLLLQRMIHLGVVVGGQTVLHAIGQKATVLAAAVVVPLIVGKALGHGAVEKREAVGHMAAATHLLRAGATFAQDGRHLLDVHRLAVVAGTHHGQLGWREAKMGHAARLDQRQRLHGLEGRSGEAQPVRVAHLSQHTTFGVGHGQCAHVQALWHTVAGQLDQGFKVHGFTFACGQASVSSRLS